MLNEQHVKYATVCALWLSRCKLCCFSSSRSLSHSFYFTLFVARSSSLEWFYISYIIETIAYRSCYLTKVVRVVWSLTRIFFLQNHSKSNSSSMNVSKVKVLVQPMTDECRSVVCWLLRSFARSCVFILKCPPFVWHLKISYVTWYTIFSEK